MELLEQQLRLEMLQLAGRSWVLQQTACPVTNLPLSTRVGLSYEELCAAGASGEVLCTFSFFHVAQPSEHGSKAHGKRS